MNPIRFFWYLPILTTHKTGCYKAVLILAILFTYINPAKAQNPTQLMNDELRHLFANLTNPNPDVRFFYDLSTKVTDSIFYTPRSYDTSNVDNWYNLYSEMYYAAYDTTLFLNSDSVFNRAMPLLQSDTVPIGIMHWAHNRLKPDALTTGDYFIFDTVNSVLYDKFPRPSSPYTVDTVFAATPLTRDVPFANVTFKVTPQLFFTDPTTDWGQDARRLYIDFDDGNGWVEMVMSTNNIHQVIYPTAGYKLIKTKVTDGVNGDLFNHSLSILNVLSAEVTIPPDDYITGIDGLDIGIYENNCNPNAMKKYVIYLEGLDIMNQNNVPAIYNYAINDDTLANLRNFGYTFVVVNWQNPYDHIENNAMRVVQLLDYLKCQTDSVAPFVIIGESMGGVISRYALTYMESPFYEGCKRELMHNTRLCITYDSPHQGANIPIGVQQLYKSIAVRLGFLFSPYALNLANIYNNKFLNGNSTKQLLIYHTESESNAWMPINSSTYTNANLRNSLLNNLGSLGNYPRYCKMVALSNGALDGSRQVRPWGNNDDRQPNDFLLRTESDFYLKVLGIKFIGSHFDLQVRTNPNGTGEVFRLHQGISHWKLKLKWFGIKLVWDHTDLIKVEKSAERVLPYCVSAGSTTVGTSSLFTTAGSGSSGWWSLLGIFYHYQTDGNGNLTFSGELSPILIPWLFTPGVDLTAYTDGFEFGYIPLHSGFDYRADNPTDLDYDIYNDAVTDIMDRTPFDAVITNPLHRVNRHHMRVVNPRLNLYESCDGEDIRSHLIPREIGDDRLYLENLHTLPPGYLIEAERRIDINTRNPLYNYPSVNSTVWDFRHADRQHYIISKEEPVSITSGAVAFRANDAVNINPLEPLVGSYQIEPGFMTLCCTNFLQRGAIKPPKDKVAVSLSAMEVYPNPVQHLLTVKYHFTTNAPVTAFVYDIMGKPIATLKMPFKDNTKESYFAINTEESNLTNGTYILRLSNGTETLYKKIVVVK